MEKVTTKRRGRGRPPTSNNVIILPVPREPDAKAISHALISLAFHFSQRSARIMGEGGKNAGH
jgi:hypothetical protein